MPRGTRHVLTGTLRLTVMGYGLEMDGGGRWRLDVAGSVRRYIGQTVTVDGVRSGFDLLDVYRIEPGSSLPSQPPTLTDRLKRKLRTIRTGVDRP